MEITSRRDLVPSFSLVRDALPSKDLDGAVVLWEEAWHWPFVDKRGSCVFTIARARCPTWLTSRTR